MDLPLRWLILDMPIRWNSTYKIISLACQQEKAITAVCVTQEIDISVRELMLTEAD